MIEPAPADLDSSNIDDIIGEVARTEAAAAPVPAEQSNRLSDAEIVALAEKIDLLVADLGKWQAYKAASTSYVEEFTSEVKWHKDTRRKAVDAAIGLALFLFCFLVLSVVLNSVIFPDGKGSAIVAIVAGCIGGSVVLALAALRGAFMPISQRNQDLPAPEHLKQLLETIGSVVKS